MDLNEIRARVRKLSGVLMPTILPDVTLDAIINEGYRYLSTLAPWTFLTVEETLPSVAGQANYTLPGDIVAARSVAVSAPSGQRTLLEFRQPHELDRYPGHAATGVPWAWTIHDDDTVRVFPPPPDASLTVLVRGVTVPPALTATDEPVFPDPYHMAVAYEGAQRVLTEEGDDSGRSQEYRAVVATHLSAMGARFLVDDPEGATRAYAGAAVGAEE